MTVAGKFIGSVALVLALANGILLASIVDVCAQEFEGNWEQKQKICNVHGMVACTKEETVEIGNLVMVCGPQLVLKQKGDRLCGLWRDGCSRGRIWTGNVAGDASGIHANIRVGEDSGQSIHSLFPNQLSELALLRIEGSHLLWLKVDSEGRSYQYAVLSRSPGGVTWGQAEREEGFLSKCFAGMDFVR